MAKKSTQPPLLDVDTAETKAMRPLVKAVNETKSALAGAKLDLETATDKLTKKMRDLNLTTFTVDGFQARLKSSKEKVTVKRAPGKRGRPRKDAAA